MNLYRAFVDCYRREASGVRIVRRTFIIEAESITDVAREAERLAEETARWSQPWIEFVCKESHRLKTPIELVATKRGLKELIVF